MMNLDKTIAAVCALHYPDAINEQSMVYEVWEDGEMTLTKAGDLYGQRNLHCIAMGAYHGLPIDSLPFKNGKHSRIVCKDEPSAQTARSLIFAYAKEQLAERE